MTNQENLKNVELFNFLIKEDFYSFLLRSFDVVNPSVEFVENWHINFICNLLEDVFSKKIKRLIINIPPRSLKSVIVSAAFPAWVLGKSPEKRIIVASYGQSIGIRHSNDCRKIMRSNWYQDIFQESIIIKGENEKHKFTTSENGYRFTTSINGTLTGEGGDILILDDPCNPVKINSKKYRNSIVDWYQSVFSSRLNNKKEGAIIIVMQRLHTEDLSGFLLENFPEDWYHLKIETINEENKLFYNNKVVKFTKKNQLSFSKQDTIESILKLKKNLGERNFLAQYQQNPKQGESKLIKESWIQYYKKDEISLKKPEIYISVDCASSISKSADFTAIAIIYVEEGKFYLKDMICKRMEYSDTKEKIEELINKYNPITTIIEDKSIGTSLINELKKKMLNISGENPKMSKEIRFLQVINFFEDKLFYIPKDEKYVKKFLEELFLFPNSRHDDQVDAIVQFFLYYQKNTTIFRKSKQKNIKFLQ